MNIGIVTDTYLPRVNGVVASIRAFAAEFRKLGHRVFVLAPKFPDFADTEPDILRFPSHYIFFDPEDRLGNPFAAESRELVRYLSEAKLDILHTQTPFTLGMTALTWAKRFKVPVVHTYHTLFEAYIHHYIRFVPPFAGRALAKYFSRWYCNRHDLTVVPSTAMAETLHAYGVHKPVAVVPTGIDLTPFAQVDGPRMRKQLGVPADTPFLLTMGRVAHEKNLPFLFDVLERLAPVQPKARLMICGQGPALEDIKAEAAKRGLGERVMFTGYLTKHDWADLYAAADLHLLASVTETQGLVLTEAMAAGTPCVAVAAMGVKDVMAGGGGLTVDLDVQHFADAVNRLLTDKALYAAKVAEAKVQAQAWSIQAKAKQLLGEYEKLLANRGKAKK
jgi:1,2-diacylglycerol 3-alpha-glucosyltransferase